MIFLVRRFSAKATCRGKSDCSFAVARYRLPGVSFTACEREIAFAVFQANLKPALRDSSQYDALHWQNIFAPGDTESPQPLGKTLALHLLGLGKCLKSALTANYPCSSPSAGCTITCPLSSSSFLQFSINRISQATYFLLVLLLKPHMIF